MMVNMGAWDASANSIYVSSEYTTWIDGLNQLCAGNRVFCDGVWRLDDFQYTLCRPSGEHTYQKRRIEYIKNI